MKTEAQLRAQRKYAKKTGYAANKRYMANKRQVSFVLTSEQYEKLEAIARETGCTVGSLIKMIIAEKYGL